MSRHTQDTVGRIDITNEDWIAGRGILSGI
jgi:hypothetical protein